MPRYVVKKGDCLSSIAAEHGLPWKVLWADPKNANLKRKRKDPNVLMPGDVVFVPDTRERMEDCATEDRHRFLRKRGRTLLRIILKDEEDEPLASKDYELTIGSQTFRATTDGDGRIEEQLPAGAAEGKLVVTLEEEPPSAFTWTLKIGCLDPVEEVSGVQGRLNNLGFDCGPVDGIIGPWTRAAVEAFQEEYGLDVDGIAGPKTQAKLKEVYGC